MLSICLLVKVRHFFKEMILNSFHRCDGHAGPAVSVRRTAAVSEQKLNALLRTSAFARSWLATFVNRLPLGSV